MYKNNLLFSLSIIILVLSTSICLSNSIIQSQSSSSSIEEFISIIDKYLITNDNYDLIKNSDFIQYYNNEQKEILEQIVRDALKNIKKRLLNGGSNGDEYNLSFDPPTYNQTVIEAFASKTLLNPQQNLTFNPYDIVNFNSTLNQESVCGVLYPDANDRSSYYLVNYTSAQEAESAGAFITHLHDCGYCSTTKDLASYMKFMDLTNPIRDCAIVSFISKEISLDCMQKQAEFSYECAVIWLYDALNTRKECLDICLYDWIHHVPSNVPVNSTNLSPCIQCDEDKSGPIFKLVAGRTRRDSGLKSSINRPPNTIANITHYYY